MKSPFSRFFGGEKEADTSAEKPANDEPEVEEVQEAEEVEVTHEFDEEAVTVKKNPEKVVVFDFGILDTFDELGVEVAGLPQANVPGYLEKYKDEKFYHAIYEAEKDCDLMDEKQWYKANPALSIFRKYEDLNTT